MDFNDVIFTRRSVRKYLPRAVEKEKLEAVLKAGVYAPTAMNNRNRKFVAVTKRNFSLGSTPPSKNRRTRQQSNESGRATVEVRLFYSAPVLIFVVSSDKIYPAADCACANENMFLAAKNEAWDLLDKPTLFGGRETRTLRVLPRNRYKRRRKGLRLLRARLRGRRNAAFQAEKRRNNNTLT
ncbi:MAG: nitroreductase family protein [Christensenellales bacterium]